MSTAFERALAFVLNHEGGISYDPADKGGLTKYGISKASYPHLNIRTLTLEQASEIYRRDFWDKCRCDDMPEGLAIAVCDTAVNMGCGTAIRLLQSALNQCDPAEPLAVDGIIGSKTVNAIGMHGADDALIAIYLRLRVQRYREIVGRNQRQGRFLKGWLRRVMDLEEEVSKIA